MRLISNRFSWNVILFVSFAVVGTVAEFAKTSQDVPTAESSGSEVSPTDALTAKEPSSSAPMSKRPSKEKRQAESSTRLQVLVVSLTVFVLAVIVGFEIIAKVPPTLHTPLMSGSNAISGITVVGALIAAGNRQGGFASFLGLLAVILANINVVGGFCVTHRMLLMFKKK